MSTDQDCRPEDLSPEINMDEAQDVFEEASSMGNKTRERMVSV